MIYEEYYKKIIKEYKISGKEMICNCPFHEENNASMHIDLMKGGYHCFGCEAKGNAKEFLQNLKARHTAIEFVGDQKPDIVINTMFDNTLYSEKPSKEEVGKIKNRIEYLEMKDYNLQDFINNFAKGMTIIPAGIKGEAEKNWNGQQVFLLDFDNKDENNYVSVNHIIDYCNQIAFMPTCIYTTFSSTDSHNKYRLVYVFKEKITNYQEALKIYNALFEKFKQFKPDTATRNLAFMFFGGKSIVFKSNMVYSAKIIEDKELEQIYFEDMSNQKLDHTEIAEILMQDERLYMYNDEIYIYNKGVYTNSLRVIEKKILDIYNKTTKRKREEVIGYIKIRLQEQKADIDTNYINFKNCLYSIKDKTVKEHTPDVFTINQIATCYNQQVKYNEDIEKFLNEITCNNKSRKEALLQIIGYCMTSGTTLQKAFIFYGKSAGNGKSTFLEVLNTLIGTENISHVAIQNLQDKFYASELKNKLLNSVSELPNIQLRTAEIFKGVVTGDRISTEKKFEDRVKSRMYAKHIFTTNELPRIIHPDNGFYRRLNIVNFKAQFTKEEKANFDINKLLSFEALEYLVIISLEAYYRLLQTRTFANEDESEMLLGRYKIENSSTLGFLSDDKNIEKLFNNTMEIKESTMFVEYQKWCEKNNKKALGRNEFYNRVRATGKFKEKTKDNTAYFEYIK